MRPAQPLESIVAGLRDAIIVLDPDRCITAWLGASTRLLGWSAEEVLGKPVDALLQPKDANGNPTSWVITAPSDCLRADTYPAATLPLSDRAELDGLVRAGERVPSLAVAVVLAWLA